MLYNKKRNPKQNYRKHFRNRVAFKNDLEIYYHSASIQCFNFNVF